MAPRLSVHEAVLIRAVLLHPVENDGIGLFRRLPKKPCDCPFRTFISAPGIRSIEHFRLRDVIAADRVGFADQHQCRRLHVAQAVRPFKVMARDAKVDELRQLGVRRPGELEKCFDFVAMAFAIFSGKKVSESTISS